MKSFDNEKGVSLVLLAISIVVLFGFGALAIDIGHLYNVKNQLQVAADSAALAACSKLDGSRSIDQKDARDSALKVAALNFADVANKNVPVLGNVPGLGDVGGASPGDPIPVVLDTAQNADVVLGYFNNGAFTPVDGNQAEPVNAVMVHARRAGDTDYQPTVSNWFAKIFGLLGADYAVTKISATAIAANIDEPLPIMPIVVNEYWADSEGTRAYPGTLHDYPNSFVREKQVAGVNADGTPKAQTIDSEAFRSTFAIMGQTANSNQGSVDPNGFVAMDYRSDYYYGAEVTGVEYDKDGNIDKLVYGPPSRYHAEPAAPGAGLDCPNCTPAFTPGPFNHGNATSEEGTVGVNYLVHGYPENKLPPLPVYEFIRTPVNDYPGTDNDASKYYSDDYPNSPSDCSYATLFYYSTSGKDPLSKNDNEPGSSKKVVDYFPEGRRFMAMVYDGTHALTPKLLTIVGYVPIEIDGYDNGANPPSFKTYAEDDTYSQNKKMLNATDGNTMYGHALGDIIQPDPNHMDTDGNSLDGYCDFLDELKAAQIEYGTGVGVRLVDDPNYTRYGLRDTSIQ